MFVDSGLWAFHTFAVFGEQHAPARRLVVRELKGELVPLGRVGVPDKGVAGARYSIYSILIN